MTLLELTETGCPCTVKRVGEKSGRLTDPGPCHLTPGPSVTEGKILLGTCQRSQPATPGQGLQKRSCGPERAQRSGVSCTAMYTALRKDVPKHLDIRCHVRE